VITVPVGTTVTWTNGGSSVHTTTSDNGVWDSGRLRPAHKFPWKFSKPGIFPYHCTIHRVRMRGTITVAPVKKAMM